MAQRPSALLEKQKLDVLLGVALLDSGVGERLLRNDETLLKTFGLSASLRRLLRQIEATTLDEYAQAAVLLWE